MPGDLGIRQYLVNCREQEREIDKRQSKVQSLPKEQSARERGRIKQIAQHRQAGIDDYGQKNQKAKRENCQKGPKAILDSPPPAAVRLGLDVPDTVERFLYL